MMFVYVSLLAVLAVVHFFVRWRVASLERRYVRTAGEADALVKKSAQRGGNVNKPDPCQAARQIHELALVVLQRDRTEARYTRWQALAERLSNWRKGLTAYKGKLVPYAVGMVDLAGVAVGLNALGVSAEQVRAMIGL